MDYTTEETNYTTKETSIRDTCKYSGEKNTEYGIYSNMGIDKRIKELVKKLTDGNVSKFAKITDITPQTLNNIVNGKNKPGAEILEKIIANTQVNAEWLIIGTGNMLKSESILSEDSPDYISSQNSNNMTSEDFDDLGELRKYTNLQEQLIELQKEKIARLIKLLTDAGISF